MKVKIKNWGKLVLYGMDSNNFINCDRGMPIKMYRELPDDRIITVVGERWKHWIISKNMIEEVISEED